jgi:ATP-binding cassette subfamily C protein LapB
MDQKTESLVVDNLKLYCADKTSIIITHRNSILSICDRIIVMENGKIIADNTPAELGIGTEKK